MFERGLVKSVSSCEINHILVKRHVIIFAIDYIIIVAESTDRDVFLPLGNVSELATLYFNITINYLLRNLKFSRAVLSFAEVRDGTDVFTKCFLHEE